MEDTVRDMQSSVLKASLRFIWWNALKQHKNVFSAQQFDRETCICRAAKYQPKAQNLKKMTKTAFAHGTTAGLNFITFHAYSMIENYIDISTLHHL